jgi:hypothetical protein
LQLALAAISGNRQDFRQHVAEIVKIFGNTLQFEMLDAFRYKPCDLAGTAPA